MWAVAFACVISVGIELVEPILKSTSEELCATPAQVSLLFTGYLVAFAAAEAGAGRADADEREQLGGSAREAPSARAVSEVG